MILEGFKQNKIALKKSNYYTKFNIKISPLMFYGDKKDAKKLFAQKVNFFLKNLSMNCKGFVSNIFQREFKKTQFYLFLEPTMKCRAGGSVKFGKKNIYTIRTFKPTYHELLHLSSYSKKDEYLPFDEGYTQLLSERYFAEHSNSYKYYVLIMKMIECGLGKDYLEQNYFRGNLTQSIYEGLSKYKIKVNDFIVLLEDFFQLLSRPNLVESEFQKLREMLQTIYSVSLFCFKERINSIDSFNQKLTELYNLEPIYSVKIGKKVLSIATEKEFHEFLNSFKLNKNATK